MENYYDLALLLLGFIAFVILWISIENWIQRKEDKENSKKLQSNHQQIVRSQNSFLAIYGIRPK